MPHRPRSTRSRPRGARRRPEQDPTRRTRGDAAHTTDAGHGGAPPGGRHELGQNDLVDRRVIADIVRLTARTDGPIVELGAGTGALTAPLARLGRPVTAIEIDPRRAAAARRRTPAGAQVVVGDVLQYRYPRSPHVVIGNLPFHLTTAILRLLLRSPGWTDAVLLTQWEVARRRAGVGGATMMTAQSWPWFDVTLERRIPRAAFSPTPAIDGGLVTIRRRREPLVDHRDRRTYERLVRAVFTGRGSGLRAVLVAAGVPHSVTSAFLRDHRLTPSTLPRDLDAAQWADLFARVGAREDRGARRGPG